MKQKNIFSALMAIMLLTGCHESLEERAEREAREYTQKNCPTPIENYQRTDSMVFYKQTLTITYYSSVFDKADDSVVMAKSRKAIHDGLLKSIRQTTALKRFKEADYNFAYVIHSGKNPKVTYLKYKFTKKDYADAGKP